MCCADEDTFKIYIKYLCFLHLKELLIDVWIKSVKNWLYQYMQDIYMIPQYWH